MRRPILSALAVFLVAAATLAAQTRAAKPLEIYVLDVEGGKATLFVSPSGESLLIDTGNPGGRDVDRIMEAVKAAGVTKIDYVILTHYHVDHIGGLQELVTRIPIGHYIDHGPTVEGPVDPAQREQVPGFQDWYAKQYATAKHTAAKPGDRIPIAGLDWRIVTSAGQALTKPLAGAPGAGRPNPACAQTKPKDVTNPRDDNGQSVVSIVTLGQFRLADFGDLLWNKEIDLMCPNNLVGTVDLFLVTHHGLNASNSPALVYGLHPRVAVMQNGTTKGAAVDVMQTLRSSPGLEDIWQAHWSYTAGIEHNAPGVFIANLEDPATLGARLAAPPRGAGGGGRPGGQGGAAAPPAAGTAAQQPTQPTPPAAGAPQAAPAAGGQPAATAAQGAAPGGGRGPGAGAAQSHTPAYWIKITAQADGTFTVSNPRNGFSKTYSHR